jgi:hypothetical protein
MTTTWVHDCFKPVKRVLPASVWRPIRSIATAFATPLQWSYRSGHFLSSFRGMAVDRRGAALPWYTYPAIDFLSLRDFAGKRVLEFGGGQSSSWWADRAESVTVIESDPEWAASISAKRPDIEVLASPTTDGIGPVESYLQGRTFDVVVIDGHMRGALVPLAFSLLNDGGAVIIDNADGYGYQGQLAKIACQRVDFFGYAPGVSLPECTTIVWRTECFLFSPSAPLPKLVGR